MNWIEPYRLTSLKMDTELAQHGARALLARWRGLARTGGLWGRCQRPDDVRYDRLFMVYEVCVNTGGKLLVFGRFLSKQRKAIGRENANGAYLEGTDWAQEGMRLEDVVLFGMRVDNGFVKAREGDNDFVIDVMNWLGNKYEGEGCPPPGGAAVSSFPTPAGDTPATPPEAT